MQIANQFSYFDFVVTSEFRPAVPEFGWQCQVAAWQASGWALATAGCGTCQTDARKCENRASHSPLTSAFSGDAHSTRSAFFTQEMHYNAYKVEERLHCHGLQKSTENCLRKHKTPLTQAAMHTW